VTHGSREWRSAESDGQRNLLASKLAELADRVNRIRPLGALSLNGLSTNRDAFDLASFVIAEAGAGRSRLAMNVLPNETTSASPASSTGSAVSALKPSLAISRRQSAARFAAS